MSESVLFSTFYRGIDSIKGGGDIRALTLR